VSVTRPYWIKPIDEPLDEGDLECLALNCICGGTAFNTTARDRCMTLLQRLLVEYYLAPTPTNAYAPDFE
jgi:hypothetical protein